jgi:hypothetical protein
MQAGEECIVKINMTVRYYGPHPLYPSALPRYAEQIKQYVENGFDKGGALTRNSFLTVSYDIVEYRYKTRWAWLPIGTVVPEFYWDLCVPR